MLLFDDVVRTYTGPKPFSEGSFTYYNRSARADVGRVRELIERWLEAYPATFRAELIGRLRQDFGAFQAAFFELYLHALLVALGHDVEPHPDVPGTSKRPDFLARPLAGGEPCYVEAAVATDESDDRRLERRLQDRIQDDINAFRDPNFFFILARLDGHPAQYPRRAALHDFCRNLLAGLDPDDVARRISEAEPVEHTLRRRFIRGGLVLEAYPWPKSPKSRGNERHRSIGAGPVRTMWSTAPEAIQAAVKSKAGRYGDPPYPYVVAVNCASEWGVDEDDVREALLGLEQATVPLHGGGVTFAYSGDGAFLHRCSPTNTRVSAVLACRGLAPHSVLTADVRLYHHVAPRRPYDGPLDLLPHAKPIGEVLRNFAGAAPPPDQLFSLPPGWPHDPRRYRNDTR